MLFNLQFYHFYLKIPLHVILKIEYLYPSSLPFAVPLSMEKYICNASGYLRCFKKSVTILITAHKYVYFYYLKNWTTLPSPICLFGNNNWCFHYTGEHELVRVLLFCYSALFTISLYAGPAFCSPLLGLLVWAS